MAVHKISPVSGELANLLNKSFANRYRTGFISVDGYILPQYYKPFADAIEDFEVRDDDVWVCSFPKTGTTWTQEMIWSICNDLDFERGKVPIAKRFPSLERSILSETIEITQCNSGIKDNDHVKDSISYTENMPSPRFIKTHLPSDLLPQQLRCGEKTPKVVYVVRNAKDTCISFYHYCKLVDGFEGSFDDFCNLFLGDKVYYGPFWKHILGFWNKRNDSNMLLLKYEDMKKDLPSVIKKTAIFLGKNLTNDQVSLLTEHLSFSSMKVNPAVNYEEAVSRAQKLLPKKREGAFMRNGNTEQWKKAMTPEVIKQFDDWIQKHFNGTGIVL